MNATEQRNHKTVTQEIASSVEALADATAARFTQTEDLVRALVSSECTHRLKLADEQRSYVDRRDNDIWNHFSEFKRRGFWSRLNWLLFGN